MLSIRMQRTGRKGHAMFRLVVQESRLTPTSGKVVAQLGSFDPHTKAATLDSAKATLFLQNGAQPSGRAALLLQKEGVELPKWVKVSTAKTGKIRHAEKLRRNQPKDETPKEEAPKEEAVTEPETAEAEPAAEAEAVAEPAAAAPDASTEAPADAPEAETGTVES